MTDNPLLVILKEYEDHPIMERLNREHDPFETLIRTILSQRTRDVLTDRAAESFFSRFSGPEDVVKAGVDEVADAIRVAGLYRQKAEAIVGVCETILREGIDLDEVVKEYPLEEARRVLTSLPGVGPKTADVTLLFAGGRDICPVDTHVRRVVTRLGLTDSTSYRAVQEAVHSNVPKGSRGKAHLALIQFGRDVCRSRSPGCDTCPVAGSCPYAR